MAEIPSGDTDQASFDTITEGAFERECPITADEAGEFLVELGEQLQDTEEITISGEDWELPFPFEDTVTLDIEFEGDHEPELEIEVELTGRRDDGIPDLS